MKTSKKISFALFGLLSILLAAFKIQFTSTNYQQFYTSQITETEKALVKFLQQARVDSLNDKNVLLDQIHLLRLKIKNLDFWMRYLEPISYKKINGPLPVEWETEVFEKYEKPYRREGAGLTLAEQLLEDEQYQKDSLVHLIQSAHSALLVYLQDSITSQIKDPQHFYFCNRLFLLNLSAIYTTGFENPNTDRIVVELRYFLNFVNDIYQHFNDTYPNLALNAEYLSLYNNLRQFTNQQSDNYEKFDHFSFIRDYVNPLYQLNQQLIRAYHLKSKSLVDYSLSMKSNSIFSKDLFFAQNTKGLYSRINDPAIQEQIWKLGQQLFYDPILSGNNERSCASCHKTDQFFTDTTTNSHLQFNRVTRLTRNTPTLLNTAYNHLLMQDGSKNTLLEQSHGVITSTLEMACAEKDILKKLLSCKDYKDQLQALLKYTPQAPKLSLEHVTSALTTYYSSFSNTSSKFDLAMNGQIKLSDSEQRGFNLFMSKAQCATCHFVPHFNGVKPPYVGSEFEVIGVPSNTLFTVLSDDSGRYQINPAPETLHAFRTGGLRNIARTAPYMHNGVFNTLQEVVDFYDAGGGAGRGLNVPNQTLSSDSLHLNADEKKDLIEFMYSLNEGTPLAKPPAKLPESKLRALNNRKVGGTY